MQLAAHHKMVDLNVSYRHFVELAKKRIKLEANSIVTRMDELFTITFLGFYISASFIHRMCWVFISVRVK